MTKQEPGSVNGGSVNSITDSRHKRFMDVQANTFAFGVILLELISGRASVSKDTGDLVDWVSVLLWLNLHCPPILIYIFPIEASPISISTTEIPQLSYIRAGQVEIEVERWTKLLT